MKPDFIGMALIKPVLQNDPFIPPLQLEKKKNQFTEPLEQRGLVNFNAPMLKLISI